MAEKNPIPTFGGARVVELIEVRTGEGAGIEGDPYREVIWYYTLDGEQAAIRDVWKERPDG